MELLKDRIRWAMDHADPPVNQAELARACKVKGPSVNNWLSGKTKSLRGATLTAAARRLGVTSDWLLTGKGQRHLNQSHGTTTPDKHDDVSPVAPESHSAILDPDTLYEALILLRHDEGNGGAYAPRPRADRLAELYRRVFVDGGRLTKAHNAEFEAEVRQRTKGDEDGTELDRRRNAKRDGGRRK